MNSTQITQTNTNTTNQNDTGATLDISKMNINEKSGVMLSEQQAVQQTLPNEYNLTVVNKRANTHLNDNAWDLESMLTRHNYVDTIAWDTTTNPGTVLFGANVIEGLLRLDINSFPFKRYRYWRAEDIRVHFQVTANRFLSGRLIAYFIPSMGTNVDVDLNTAVQLEHVFLDPSAASAVEMVIPFNYFKGYIDLNQGDTLGVIQLAVFNTLSAATGISPTIDVKIYMSVTGSEFKVPLPGSVGFTRSITKHSSLLSALDNGFQALTQSIMPSEIITDLIGGLLDKPEEPEQPAPIVNKDMEYLSNARGAEYLEKLNLDPSAQQLVDFEHFSTNQDEMDIDYLLKKKMSFIRRVDWTQNDPVGTILWWEGVGPLLSFLNQLSNGYGTRLVDYVALNFAFWKGGLKYIFDVVGTQLHEGRLDVMFFPGQLNSITDYKAATSVYMGSVVIRNGENAFAFIAPFLSETPYKQVYYGGPLSTSFPDARVTDYSSGTIQLVVANQLRAPTNVPANVLINIFQSAAEDFELTMPSIRNHSVKITQMNITKHSSDMPNLNNPADVIKAPTLAAGVGASIEPKITQFGEKYPSLREMCKRYQHGTTIVVNPEVLPLGSVKDEILAGTRPFIQVIQGEDLFSSSFLRRMTAMYRTVRGPIRLKIRPRNTNQAALNSIIGYATYYPQQRAQVVTPELAQELADHFQTDIGGSSAIPRARFSNTQTAEFEVPFLHQTGVALIRKPSDPTADFNYTNYWNPSIIIATYGNFVIPTYLDILVAIGDNTRFGTFMGIPQVAPSVNTQGRSPYPDLWITPTQQEEEEEFVHITKTTKLTP